MKVARGHVHGSQGKSAAQLCNLIQYSYYWVLVLPETLKGLFNPLRVWEVGKTQRAIRSRGKKILFIPAEYNYFALPERGVFFSGLRYMKG